jgi:hypothetical protein
MISISESSLNYVCKYPIVEDDCGIRLIRYYYDSDEQRCRRHIYQGCPDYGNRFESLSDCKLHCPSDRPEMTHLKQIESMSDRQSIEKSALVKRWISGDRCLTSDWSDWSKCFDCFGYRLRFRELQYPNQYSRCSVQLLEKQRCDRLVRCRQLDQGTDFQIKLNLTSN